MQVERESPFGGEYSGARVSNTWVIYLLVGDNTSKEVLIRMRPLRWAKMASPWKLSPEDEPAPHQFVGRVMAYQGYDG